MEGFVGAQIGNNAMLDSEEYLNTFLQQVSQTIEAEVKSPHRMTSELDGARKTSDPISQRQFLGVGVSPTSGAALPVAKPLKEIPEDGPAIFASKANSITSHKNAALNVGDFRTYAPRESGAENFRQSIGTHPMIELNTFPSQLASSSRSTSIPFSHPQSGGIQSRRSVTTAKVPQPQARRASSPVFSSSIRPFQHTQNSQLRQDFCAEAQTSRSREPKVTIPSNRAPFAAEKHDRSHVPVPSPTKLERISRLIDIQQQLEGSKPMQEEPESATANNSFHDDSATLREETMNKNALAATKDLFGTDCHSNEPQRQAFTFNNCKFAYSVPNTSHDLVVGMMQTKKPFNGRITVTGSEAGNRLSIFCLFDDGQVAGKSSEHKSAEASNGNLEFDPEFSPGHELSISDLSISCIDGDSGTKRLSETAAKKKAKDDVLTSSIFGSDWIDDESSDIATHSEEDALSSFLEQPFSSIQRRETLPASPLKPKPMPMSFRLTEAMLKKRHHELDIINAELAELSKILGSKREQLRRKENALKEKEKRLAEAQERMDLDIRETLRQKTEERDNFLKREVEAIILESDTSVACLGKENRRLVISNKELSAANRKLRDQVRTMTQAISERDARESELHNQLKQQKDRIDRLRKAASDVKPAKLVIERLARSSHATDVHHPKARMTDGMLN
ncbi:hypothetical protein HDU83_004451 [Entophlyctis luteolus]|nr:hypothetical protein HDU83_004451 [Entophlyctis luteolus]